MTSTSPVVQLDSLAAVPCPCGQARRAFVQQPGAVASVHLVEIRGAAKVHYHRKTTEIYVVLAGEGEIELDGQRYPVRPLSAVYIAPGVRHRAIGDLRVINIPVPAFDAADEYVDV
jgi:quercetin dioxygenase-like cupin family protein